PSNEYETSASRELLPGVAGARLRGALQLPTAGISFLPDLSVLRGDASALPRLRRYACPLLSAAWEHLRSSAIECDGHFVSSRCAGVVLILLRGGDAESARAPAAAALGIHDRPDYGSRALRCATQYRNCIYHLIYASTQNPAIETRL